MYRAMMAGALIVVWARVVVAACLAGLLLLLVGCSTAPVIETKVVDRPVPVFCEVATPPECKSAYAVDRVSVKDDPLTINRALRAEIEERWACEVKLLAAVKGCNSKAVKVR